MNAPSLIHTTYNKLNKFWRNFWAFEENLSMGFRVNYIFETFVIGYQQSWFWVNLLLTVKSYLLLHLMQWNKTDLVFQS